MACAPVTATDSADAGSGQDVGDLAISSLTQSVLEGGTAQFTVSLSAEPAGDVPVTLSSSDLAKVRVMPASLQFDASNWSTPREVTVFGEQDADAMDDGAAIAVTSAVGAATVAIAVLDDDTPAGNVAIEVSTTSVGVIEGMQTVFQVRLTAQPTATTTVSIASSNATSVSVSPDSLTFTTADWDTFQNVVLTGVEDDNVVADLATATVSSSGLASKGLMVTTTDNDTQALVVSQSTTLTVNEGSFQSFSVRMAFEPPSDVTVAVSSGVTTASISQTSLTFTSANWNTNQTVSVGGVQDTDFTHDQTTITVSSSGLITKQFPVIVPDNDLIKAPAGERVCENFTTNPVFVELNGALFGSSLLVTATATNGTVTPSSFTFTAIATSKNFSFDPTANQQSGTLTLAAPGQTSRTVSITILDSTDPECSL